MIFLQIFKNMSYLCGGSGMNLFEAIVGFKSRIVHGLRVAPLASEDLLLPVIYCRHFFRRYSHGISAVFCLFLFRKTPAAATRVTPPSMEPSIDNPLSAR